MQVTIDLERLRKSGIFCAIPCYGGMMHTLNAKSLIDLNALCLQNQIPIRFSFLMNESLIARARNYLCEEYLRSEPNFEYFLFIDSDISFNCQDVLTMMALDKDIIFAPYSKKCIKWDNIKEAVIKNPNIKPEDLERLGGDFVFNPIAGTQQFNVSQLVSVQEAATGFLMVKRGVFNKFKEAHPELMYPPDHNTPQFNSSMTICAFFNDGIFPKYSPRFLSEDWTFSNMVKELGYDVWMAPFISLQHSGTYCFNSSLPAVANYLGHL